MSEATDGVENAPLFLQSYMMKVMWEVLPDATVQALHSAVSKLVIRPVRHKPEGGGRGSNPNMFRFYDAMCLHYACSWEVCVGEQVLGRRLGHNAGAFLRGQGLNTVLGLMAQGYSVLQPMLTPTTAWANLPPTLIRPEDRPTDPALWGTLHPWPDLRDSLSAALKKLNEVVHRPARPVAKVFRPTALASKALAEVARLSSLTLPEPNKD